MPKQPAFPCLTHAMKKKRTLRELFLAEIDAVAPWIWLLGLIEDIRRPLARPTFRPRLFRRRRPDRHV
jgi:hypothetical protein